MRRVIIALATGALLAGLAGPASAFDSGDRPSGLGPDSIVWTGQGASDGLLDSELCAPDPGATEEGSYLLWVFETDGGSVSDGSGAPLLYLDGDRTTPYGAVRDAAGASWTFVTPYRTPDATLSAEVDFTVTTTGRGAWNLTISHGCASTVPVGEDLTVTATATPAFTRTYDWTIAKTVDRTRVAQFGGSATFAYLVTASQTGVTDADWSVTGTIVVHNPNDAPVALTGVTAAVDDGGDCSVTGDPTQTVAPDGDSDGLGYTCTWTTRPDPRSGTATATATWDPAIAGTPTGSANGSADFTFDEPTTRVDPTVTVTDSVAGLLGTLTAAEEPTYATADFSYSRTIEVPTWDCLAYDNTATIVETDLTAGVTVQVCGPARTGALTIGYWQNRNGQGIIGSGAVSGTVCTSGTWLRGFLPFGDLSASATCSQVAGYVTNVIRAANASGASMNAMLKAQDLAVSLDVFFSDPALGGNRIGATGPLGAVSVDLTTVCRMSGGSASTCAGATQDLSGFFGARCLTVSELLAAQAAASNVGGSLWYANVKAQQELAKNLDDAIANNRIFACPTAP